MAPSEIPKDTSPSKKVVSASLGFLGLSPNLWRVAILMGIAQFSIGLWKWEFGIFLETGVNLQPWQMGLTFSAGTAATLIGAFLSGTVADLLGRKWTLAVSMLPIAIGLMAMAFLPIWPIIPLQFALIWMGMSSVRTMSAAIPADEVAADAGKNPAKRFMMVMMPSWFVDGLSPLLGTFLLGYEGVDSSHLHFLASIGAVVAFLVAGATIKESLRTEITDKARSGPVLSFRKLGKDYWKIVVGMLPYIFFYTTAIQYLGNLCVRPDGWGVDRITYGFTWSVFSLTSAAFMYFMSGLTDRNLKAALVTAVAGNGLVFIVFGLGNGVELMFLLNFVWALPFIVWLGAERSLLVANVPEEAKGRAFGTYTFITNLVGVFTMSLGSILWEITDSLRFVWTLSGIGMTLTVFLLIPILRTIKTNSAVESPIPPPME
ncbi:MAG: MFS transporter [Candidatus Thorarchaeota archaeon]|nr:MFS transporter [Candidatus Thorarchaeota archaeon]